MGLASSGKLFKKDGLKVRGDLLLVLEVHRCGFYRKQSLQTAL